MIIRNLLPSDYELLTHFLTEADLTLPAFHGLLCFYVVEDSNGNIVSFAYIKTLAEAVFIPKQNASKRDKVESFKLLDKKLIEITQGSGLEQIHVFVKNQGFKDILQKHFNYSPITGDGLVLNVGKHGKG